MQSLHGPHSPHCPSQVVHGITQVRQTWGAPLTKAMSVVKSATIPEAALSLFLVLSCHKTKMLLNCFNDRQNIVMFYWYYKINANLLARKNCKPDILNWSKKLVKIDGENHGGQSLIYEDISVSSKELNFASLHNYTFSCIFFSNFFFSLTLTVWTLLLA